MQASTVILTPSGMNKDIGLNIHNPNLARELLNIRITSTKENEGTTNSLVTEKGNSIIELWDDVQYNSNPSIKQSATILGDIVGKCILSDRIILFTAANNSINHIYELHKIEEDYVLKTLFTGKLNITIEHPVEAIHLFENDNILKIYWTDNFNLPRLINIKNPPTNVDISKTYAGFDFVPTMPIKESISITKTAGNGSFPSGVIQYAFTYCRINGQESNIFYISDLYDLSFRDRGGSPEENVACSFNININNADTSFDYVRIYSIIKTSIDGNTSIKKVVDLPIADLEDSEISIDPIETTITKLGTGFTISPQGVSNPFSWGYKPIGSGVITPMTWDEALAHIYQLGEILVATGTFSATINLDGDTTEVISVINGTLEFPITEVTSSGTTGAYAFDIFTEESTDIGWVNYTIYFKYNTSTQINITTTTVPGAIKSISDFTDTNTTGELVSSTHLLYTGGTDLRTETLAIKDNTLFLGNITLPVKPVGTLKVNNVTVEDFVSTIDNYSITELYKIIGKDNATKSYYGYKPESLNNSFYKTLKAREYYRLGILFQSNKGIWSEPLYIKDYKITSNPKIEINELKGINLKVNINSVLSNILLTNNFIKARPVIVYPTVSEREVIALGVVNPTLFNVEDRKLNAPTNIASWYFRPTLNTTFVPTNTMPGLQGVPVEFRHYKFLPDNTLVNCEIQANASSNVNDIYLSEYIATSDDFLQRFGDRFAIDSNLVTFNSPDIEFDDSITVLDKTNLKFRIIGFSHFTGNKPEINITTITGPEYPAASGFIERNYGSLNYDSTNGCNILPSCPVYNDKSNNTSKNIVAYTWHACQSMAGSKADDDVRYGLLDLKKMANFRYSGHNTYLASPASITYEITPVHIFDPETDKILVLEKPLNSNINNITYLGNVDKVVYDVRDYMYNKYTGEQSRQMNSLNAWNGVYTNYSISPISEPSNIKFNSTKHAVFAFNWTSSNQLVVLPTVSLNAVELNPVVNDTTYRPFWSDSLYDIVSNTITLDNIDTDGGGLWLGELYREVDTTTIFGGTSKTAIENNDWVPCGNPVDIISNKEIDIVYNDGDTYYQRYDCIKTYPNNPDNKETLVEIGSFLVETHINLDGRYDKNRGSLKNINVTPLNYNLLNPVYQLKNNYFKYHGLNYNNFKTDSFKNTVIWTPTKINSEIIDSFTNITMLNTMDVDGSLGPIRSLKLFNNNIIGFQDKGLFTFLYNSRVLIPTSDGVPIEMASSSKVEGLKYISTSTGCNNKLSICLTPYGIYYIDTLNKSLKLFSDGLRDLSEEKGFSSWFKNKVSYTDSIKTNVIYKEYFTIDYDNIMKDVYITNKDYCLVYSEPLQLFSSFYNYNIGSNIFNSWGDTFSILTGLGNNTSSIWKHWEGEYNTFYGNTYPSEITYLINPYPQINKIFNTIEINAEDFNFEDITSNCGKNLDLEGILNLVDTKGKISTLKKKLNMYRTPIPRANNNKQSRMTGPWLLLKLIQNHSNRSEIHNLNVNYNY